MRIFQQVPQIDFLGKKYIAFACSAILLLFSIYSVFFKGFKYNVDFKGGTEIQIQFEIEPNQEDIRRLLSENFESTPVVRSFGTKENHEVLISLGQEKIEQGKSISDKLEEVLKKEFPKFEIRKVDTVGPKVGNKLKTSALYSILVALICILLYIWIRFQFRYGIGAIIALFHDVFITLGIFAFAEKEIAIPIIAALLTIVGYSLNDTIVVFDRIRENVIKLPKKNLEEVVNISVNESLSRTILTSITTLLVVSVLFTWASENIQDFSFALLIGLAIGTYSSIFVASPVMIFLEKKSSR